MSRRSLIGLGKAIAPGLDPKLVAGELRERVLEELDFELEAQQQRTFARAYRGHPFIYVPAVVTALSRRRVLVSRVGRRAHGSRRSWRSSRTERDRVGRDPRALLLRLDATASGGSTPTPIRATTC